MTTRIDVELRHLTKTFGAVAANTDVSLHFRPGTIHGLVGENGAGKSTCMKMLYGLYAPDQGEILVDQKPLRFRSPTDAIAVGIGMVHQHFMLADKYSVLDNIILGAEPSNLVGKLLPALIRPIDRKGAAAQISQSAKQYGLEVPLYVPVGSLPVGMQQRIEIIKLLYRHARLLVLDEPTAVLTPGETRTLFENLRKMRTEGHSIVIITHKLEEVMAITDEVSVLRAGRLVGHVHTKDTSINQLASMMVGREINLHLNVTAAAKVGETVLELRHLTLADRRASRQPRRQTLEHISLAVRSGEIVGIAGVEGNGQRDLFHAILRTNRREFAQSGDVHLLGQDAGMASPQHVRSLSIGVIPYDRLAEGLLTESSATENCILGYQRRPQFQQFGVLRLRQIGEWAQKIFDAFDVRPRDLATRAGSFSGGNQQKLIAGRELLGQPRLVIAANPIRGVDVGAIEFIHTQLVKARDFGAGVLLFSCDLDEILTLSDRILVMYEGRIAATFERGRCTVEDLGIAMGGGGQRHG